jgi:hypothetical protein
MNTAKVSFDSGGIAERSHRVDAEGLHRTPQLEEM